MTINPMLSAIRHDTRNAFCRCTSCHAGKVLRIDAFCEGLLAGLRLAETAFDGPQHTGTGNLPSSALAGDLDAFLSDTAKAMQTGLKVTVRPPRMVG